jgi:hypothetical protein
MAYLTIHELNGDPGELLARKRASFDPVTSANASVDAYRSGSEA